MRQRGTSRTRGRTYGSGLALFVGAIVSAVVLTACGTATTYPSFFPKKTLTPEVDHVMIGTLTKPALQIEGLPVSVNTTGFHVQVTVSGPIVPGEGLPYQPDGTTCTWTVTMHDIGGDVPVSVADFHSVDHLGAVYLMGLVPGERALARVLHAGQSLTFRLRAYELVGEGMMQWAPDHHHVVAYWDYTVEND